MIPGWLEEMASKMLERLIQTKTPNKQSRGAEAVMKQNGIAGHVDETSDKKNPTTCVPRVDWNVPTDPEVCKRCRNTHQVANTPDMEPWAFWTDLLDKLKRAIDTGALRPIPCPDCVNPKPNEDASNEEGRA